MEGALSGQPTEQSADIAIKMLNYITGTV